MKKFQEGDRAYVRTKTSEWCGYHGNVVRTAPSSIGGQLVFMTFDGWKEVCFYEVDLLKVSEQ